MRLLSNLPSPSRRKADRADNDRGMLLNEVAIWLLVVGIILGIGGYFGLPLIFRTKAAAERQQFDVAVSVADSIYSQQIDGTTSFFGPALTNGEALTAAKTVTSTDANVVAIIKAWNLAGEGLEFVWWPAAALASGTWHGTLTDEANTGKMHIYVNHAKITWDQPGTTATTDDWSIPAGQMLLMATGDSDGNTYCASYVRQVVTPIGKEIEGYNHIGIGYQSKKAATPAKLAAGNEYQSKYADCGMEFLNIKSDGSAREIKTALPKGNSNAELPELNTRSTLGDPE